MKKPIAYRITSLLPIENPSDYHHDEADHKTESNRNFRTGRQLVARAVSTRRRKSDGRRSGCVLPNFRELYHAGFVVDCKVHLDVS
jgi:hypothetical protein